MLSLSRISGVISVMNFDDVINIFLDFLPKKELRCDLCQRKHYLKRGEVRDSTKRHNGPYCPWCGNKNGGKKEKNFKPVFSN